jgi:hypothetical protein
MTFQNNGNISLEFRKKKKFVIKIEYYTILNI